MASRLEPCAGTSEAAASLRAVSFWLILGHHHHLTRARPDFSGKLGERIRSRDVQNGVRRAAVPIATRNGREVRREGQRLNAGILLSRTMAVQLEGVKVPAMRGEEAAKLAHVLVVTNPCQIPQWMAQHNERLPHSVQLAQEIGQ